MVPRELITLHFPFMRVTIRAKTFHVEHCKKPPVISSRILPGARFSATRTRRPLMTAGQRQISAGCFFIGNELFVCGKAEKVRPRDDGLARPKIGALFHVEHSFLIFLSEFVFAWARRQKNCRKLEIYSFCRAADIYWFFPTRRYL